MRQAGLGDGTEADVCCLINLRKLKEQYKHKTSVLHSTFQKNGIREVVIF